MSLPVDVLGRGVALVPDCLVNPAAPRYAYLELASTDLLAVLGRCGFGLLQLPSHVAGDPEEGQGVTGFPVSVVESFLTEQLRAAGRVRGR